MQDEKLVENLKLILESIADNKDGAIQDTVWIKNSNETTCELIMSMLIDLGEDSEEIENYFEKCISIEKEQV